MNLVNFYSEEQYAALKKYEESMFRNKDSNSLVSFGERNKILVDEWIPTPDDLVFKHVDKAIILPIASYYGMDPNVDNPINYFIIAPKRCYNKDEMRDHTTKYLNYFEKFYDKDHELVFMCSQIKFCIDFIPEYTKENFINDLIRYIIRNQSLLMKLYLMNEENYLVELKAKKGKSIPSLQYSTKHGKILMQMSLLMNMCIPLTCHFAHINKIDNIDGILLEVFDEILDISTVDVYAKFYETATSEIKRNQSINSTLWMMQDIRGKNGTTHSRDSIDNIILNIMPKYTYDRNIISFNCTSIRKNTGFKITDIKYEYSYTLLSSSNRDEDFTSDFDKFESYLVRQDEALYLQNKVNCQETMKMIENAFGPLEQREIDYMVQTITQDGSCIISKFQMNLIFNLFYKYFGDPVSIKAINQTDYVKLMLAAKKILQAYNMVILPYIFSGKVVRIPNKKNINKKELLKIQASPIWKMVQEKYQNPKIEDSILGDIGVILSSEFKFISLDEPELDGNTIAMIDDIVAEEYLIYILLI